RALLGIGARGPLMLALRAGEHRNPVTPPDLPRDVPVADALHPVVVRRAPALRHDLVRALAKLREDGLRQRLHFHEPLVAEPRLDHRVAPIAAPHGMPVRLGFDEETFALELLDDALASLEAIDTLELPRDTMGISHGPVLFHDQRHLQLVAQPDLEVVRVVGGSHLHESRPEFLVDTLICY